MPYPLTYMLADDDELYREYTLQQLHNIAGLECLCVCENALATREQLQHFQPDLLILDVEMPGLTGIQLAKSIKQLPLTIFITSHPSYAADAYELDAVDYLVKPVPPERLLRAIDKVRVLASIKANTSAGEGFQQKDAESFFIKDKNTFLRITYTDVLYAESLGDFVNIFLQNGEKKIALVSMKNLEQQLPPNLFIRISRSHLVNRQKVTAVDTDTVHINKIQLPIGKTYAEEVMNAIIGNQAIKRFI
ncbi:LytR/AlgR family response regulator transcription factor [Ferruginibacter sp. SUN106]|uniref:LytR/AlgR family response regulator transcription factor n=1 Tax=Ferruginibacter sp. SUN106 TaxID=2978348 RepID=UPI003D35E94D